MREFYVVGMVLSVMSAASSGDTFAVPLPELTGPYYPWGSATASFDFGTSFQSIEEVRIHWAGTLTPGLGHGDGIEMPEDVWFSWPTEIGAVMNPPDPSLWHAYAGPYDGPFEIEQPFEPFPGSTWDFLLDGQGDVTVFLDPMIVIGGVMVTPPTGEITDAYLVVEGIVPEPAMSWLLPLLALGLPRRARRARRLSLRGV
jgi:hypothetical protein